MGYLLMGCFGTGLANGFDRLQIEYIKPLLFRQGRLWNQKRIEEDIGVCR